MKLNEISRIKQTSEEREVNEHLAKGYEVIKVFSSKITTESGEFIQPTYVLGLKRK